MFKNASNYEALEKALGYEFKNRSNLQQALTRRSAYNERQQFHAVGDFQRLEFIGDKVLNFIISDILYDNNPSWKEGELTIKTSELVNNKGPLAIIAKQLELGRYLIIGRGEESHGIREQTKALSDAFEALVGAIWVDSDKNFPLLKSFLLRMYRSLGLTDERREYQDMLIQMGLRQMESFIMAAVLPEFYGEGTENEVGVSYREALREYRMRRKFGPPPEGSLAATLSTLGESPINEEPSEEDEPLFETGSESLASSSEQAIKRPSQDSFFAPSTFHLPGKKRRL